MDFLKSLFSSGNEDQSVNNINEPESSEPTPGEPPVEAENDNPGESDDSSLQE